MKKVILTMVVAVLATSGMAQSDCGELLDHDQDGVIGVEDLMNLLSFFGQPLEVDAGPCDNLESVTFDGYDYDLVAIGDQCWFAENLRTEHYANGDAIPQGLSDSEWGSTTSGAVTVFGEGTSFVFSGSDDEVSNLSDYGRLYNWYAVDDTLGLCPSGWHVPTDVEFMTLEMALGMSESDALSGGWRGWGVGTFGIGTQMKSSPSDMPSWDGINNSGFSASAGGTRGPDGTFFVESETGYFWTSSLHGPSGWYRMLGTGNYGVHRTFMEANFGYSIRCLKDSE